MEINLYIPTGESGDWEIGTFKVSKEDAEKFKGKLARNPTSL